MSCGPVSITCPWCEATSHHPTDVAMRYCGRCHRFHDQPPPNRPEEFAEPRHRVGAWTQPVGEPEAPLTLICADPACEVTATVAGTLLPPREWMPGAEAALAAAHETSSDDAATRTRPSFPRSLP